MKSLILRKFCTSKFINEFKLSENIPANLAVKTLTFPPNKSECLVFGIENNNPEHVSYIVDAMRALKFDSLILSIPPDEPFFIKAKEKSFIKAWKDFVRGDFGSKFIVNPLPSLISELALNSKKISNTIESIVSSEEFEDSGSIMYRKCKFTEEMVPDGFWTSFYFCQNNLNRNIQIFLSGYPELKFRENISFNLTVSELQNYLIDAQSARASNAPYFDPHLLNAKLFLDPKIKLACEIMKQVLMFKKKTLAIMTIQEAQRVESEWLLIEGKVKSIKKLISPEISPGSVNFMDFLERVYLVEKIFGNYLEKNYIQYKTFPFSVSGIHDAQLFVQSIFLIWDHLATKHNYASPFKAPLQNELTDVKEEKDGKAKVYDFEKAPDSIKQEGEDLEMSDSSDDSEFF